MNGVRQRSQALCPQALLAMPLLQTHHHFHLRIHPKPHQHNRLCVVITFLRLSMVHGLCQPIQFGKALHLSINLVLSCELMEKSNPDSYLEWCAFLSQGIVSDRTAANACCFCGGGQLVKPMTCQNQLFSDLKGSNIDCEFIEKSPNPEEFCADLGNTKFSSTGPSIIDACCILNLWGRRNRPRT